MRRHLTHSLLCSGSLPVTAFALASENGLLYGELRRIARREMQEPRTVHGFRPEPGSFRQR
jgi:hypothetical protein